MAAESAPRRMTVEEYLVTDDASVDVKYEYYDGSIIAMAGGSNQHGEICGFMTQALLNRLDKPCRLYTSDVRVKVATAQYVYPDVTVSCSEADRTNREGIVSPRVVVEVLSPGTVNIDRGRKFHQYRACLSIAEYVLINTSRPLVEVFHRDGRFLVYAALGMEDILDLASIGVQIPVAEIYRDIEFPAKADIF